MESKSSVSKPEFDIFISYAKADEKKALEICNALEAQSVLCWVAARNLSPDSKQSDEITRAIEDSACLVIILSGAANESHLVEADVEQAVSYGKPVFSFRIEDILPTEKLQLFTSNAHWIDAWHGNLREHIDRITDALQSVSQTLNHPDANDKPKQKRTWFGLMRKRW
ncbi:toll/interleukin-1 receptor domain-containing protein [Alteromonas sp. ASW11-36]|uniref:Toll/interleukin-1 receptor domain-containing protein n=1 Tax=Alteromonas arenosi TaxID=3055817 RepID=A0ABT7ST79_9ALTE|nr:toll/interleukin-1 receptor domain-containing protein [Alteromonas sp. ASW11-36]MDM7859380.1 toll/interleukin-1 receptor domain-containing protein [Alteromonas sp. ASW11-36]